MKSTIAIFLSLLGSTFSGIAIAESSGYAKISDLKLTVFASDDSSIKLPIRTIYSRGGASFEIAQSKTIGAAWTIDRFFDQFSSPTQFLPSVDLGGSFLQTTANIKSSGDVITGASLTTGGSTDAISAALTGQTYDTFFANYSTTGQILLPVNTSVILTGLAEVHAEYNKSTADGYESIRSYSRLTFAGQNIVQEVMVQSNYPDKLPEFVSLSTPLNIAYSNITNQDIYLTLSIHAFTKGAVTNAIPEPAPIMLLICGLGVLYGSQRFRRPNQNPANSSRNQCT